MVEAGIGLVKANTLAAANESAAMLNSASGVMFPGSSRAPPIMINSFARHKVLASFAAASAMFVSGPIAITETVPGGSDSSMERISKWEGRDEGMNSSGFGFDTWVVS